MHHPFPPYGSSPYVLNLNSACSLLLQARTAPALGGRATTTRCAWRATTSPSASAPTATRSTRPSAAPTAHSTTASARCAGPPASARTTSPSQRRASAVSTVYRVVPRLRECCRQSQADVVSMSSNKIHQTWCTDFCSACLSQISKILLKSVQE